MEEANVRELRSSRSRSNTPFIRARESTHGTEEVRHVTSTTQTKGRCVSVFVLNIYLTQVWVLQG
jgi:hypothetical protein